jgi:hypothetical protein
VPSYFIILILCLEVGCASPPRILGRYELRAVNRDTLPARVTDHPQGAAQIVAGSITLNSDGSYDHRLLFRVRHGARWYTDSAVTVGRYTLQDGAVLLRTTTGDMPAQLAAGSLTINLYGWTYHYRLRERD